MGIISDISADVSIDRRTKSTTFTLPAKHADCAPDVFATGVLNLEVDNTLLPTLLEAVWQAYHRRRDRRVPYSGPERRRIRKP